MKNQSGVKNFETMHGSKIKIYHSSVFDAVNGAYCVHIDERFAVIYQILYKFFHCFSLFCTDYLLSPNDEGLELIMP